MDVRAELTKVADALVRDIKGFVAQTLQPLRTRVDTFSHRIEAVEQRTISLGARGVGAALLYKGVWHDSDYERGDVCTRDGSLWHCERATKSRPPSDDWRLCVKRGGEGPPGPQGDPPAHRWEGTTLFFQNPDGSWDDGVDLEGPAGPPGKDGGVTYVPVGLPATVSANSYFPAGW